MLAIFFIRFRFKIVRVLPKYNVAIFINGCFWHKHNCKYFVWPKKNADFWRSKLEQNALRDEQNYEKLKEMGWRVLVVWECTTRNRESFEQTMNELISKIKKDMY